MSDYGIKVSKDGFDVLTAAVKDQVFNSSYSNFKIAAEGSASVSVPASGGAQHTITHGLSNTPGFLAFAQLSGGNNSVICGSTDPAGLGEGFNGKSTSTQVIFDFDSNGTAYTASLYYYIIVDPAL